MKTLNGRLDVEFRLNTTQGELAFDIPDLDYFGTWNGTGPTVACVWPDDLLWHVLRDMADAKDVQILDHINEARHQIDSTLNSKISEAPWRYL